jgi:outer membrane lipoprotein LolB
LLTLSPFLDARKERERELMFRASRKIQLALLVLLVPGCATLPPESEPSADGRRLFRDREVEIESLSNWTFNGRVSVKADDEGWTARIRWDQKGERYDIRVVAPFGQGTFLITGSPGAVVLTDRDGVTHSAAAPEQLLDRELGWTLPLTGLLYWVRGITDPEAAIDHMLLDDEARLRDLQQSGWRISVLDYRPVERLQLPARMFMLSDRLEVRLAIQQWRLAL